MYHFFVTYYKCFEWWIISYSQFYGCSLDDAKKELKLKLFDAFSEEIGSDGKTFVSLKFSNRSKKFAFKPIPQLAKIVRQGPLFYNPIVQKDNINYGELNLKDITPIDNNDDISLGKMPSNGKLLITFRPDSLDWKVPFNLLVLDEIKKKWINVEDPYFYTLDNIPITMQNLTEFFSPIVNNLKKSPPTVHYLVISSMMLTLLRIYTEIDIRDMTTWFCRPCTDNEDEDLSMQIKQLFNQKNVNFYHKPRVTMCSLYYVKLLVYHKYILLNPKASGKILIIVTILGKWSNLKKNYKVNERQLNFVLSKAEEEEILKRYIEVVQESERNSTYGAIEISLCFLKTTTQYLKKDWAVTRLTKPYIWKKPPAHGSK